MSVENTVDDFTISNIDAYLEVISSVTLTFYKNSDRSLHDIKLTCSLESIANILISILLNFQLKNMKLFYNILLNLKRNNQPYACKRTSHECQYVLYTAIMNKQKESVIIAYDDYLVRKRP